MPKSSDEVSKYQAAPEGYFDPLPCMAITQYRGNDFQRQFEKDAQYFNEVRKSAIRTTIRAADAGEFENLIWLNLPMKPPLWVYVFQASASLHIAMPIWRGNPFFMSGEIRARLEVYSDDEIASVIQICQERGGYDEKDWAAFLSRCREAQ